MNKVCKNILPGIALVRAKNIEIDSSNGNIYPLDLTPLGTRGAVLRSELHLLNIRYRKITRKSRHVVSQMRLEHLIV